MEIKKIVVIGLGTIGSRAVVEWIDIKHDIYKKIFKERKKSAIVSSNTSHIPIKVLCEHLSENDLFKLELGAFMRSVETNDIQNRIKHTIAAGKPLIN